MDISSEKNFFPFPEEIITNYYQNCYFMIANKFLGSVGLVQIYLIERNYDLGSFLFCLDIFPHGISFFKKRSFLTGLILPVFLYPLY